ncbi:MAG: LytTR family DNA-binding domain-containing protein [Bacteroidia bacterium]|nr:LytTR family DNA-binding domain-containing protein [Bacteroidia bacterium]
MSSLKLSRLQLRKRFPIVFQSWKVVLFFGLFTTFFLFFFEPFGFGPIQLSQKAYWTMLHGGVTIVALFFNVQLLPRVFKSFFHPDKWTRWKHGVWFIWNVTTVGSANYILSQWIYEQDNLAISVWIEFLLYSSLLASIPVGILLLMTRIKVLKSKKLSKGEIAEESVMKLAEEKRLSLYSESGKQQLTFNPLHLIYIESSKNYLQVCLFDGEKLRKFKLRNTLKNVEKQLAEFNALAKVHRAFLVNLNQVGKIQKAGHAYKLHFSDIKEEVPLSRRHLNQVKDWLREKL